MARQFRPWHGGRRNRATCTRAQRGLRARLGLARTFASSAVSALMRKLAWSAGGDRRSAAWLPACAPRSRLRVQRRPAFGAPGTIADGASSLSACAGAQARSTREAACGSTHREGRRISTNRSGQRTSRASLRHGGRQRSARRPAGSSAQAKDEGVTPRRASSRGLHRALQASPPSRISPAQSRAPLPSSRGQAKRSPSCRRRSGPRERVARLEVRVAGRRWWRVDDPADRRQQR